MLQKILEFVGSPKEEQQIILNRYQNLVIKEITNQLLVKLADNPNPPPLSIINKLNNNNQTIQEIMEVYNYIDKSSTEAEKNDFGNVAGLKMFLEIIEPILNNSNEEDLAQIRQILKSDNLFYQLYTSSLN